MSEFDDETPKYSLALAFDNDDPMFVRGVEVGRLYEQFKTNDDRFEQTVHATNAEMVLRIAEATDREILSAEIIDDRWMSLEVEARLIDE